jgi:hypothetical protein
MVRNRITALALLILVAGAGVLSAAEYEDFFVGFSTEATISSDLNVKPAIPDSLTFEAISFAATYGPAAVTPVRFRAGLGWFPTRPFRLFTGVEIPLYEQLNRARARFFGVYLLGDLGLTLPIGLTAEATVAVLIPTNALGGLRFGVGINREADLLFTISTATGAYPLRLNRDGASTPKIL